MTRLYWVCCVALENGASLSIGIISKDQLLEKVRVYTFGRMPDYFVGSFGVC